MDAKYIVFTSWDNFEEIVIFSARVIHRDTARGMRGTVLSAGFMQISNGKAHCFGESESIGIESRGSEDSKLANEMLGLT